MNKKEFNFKKMVIEAKIAEGGGKINCGLVEDEIYYMLHMQLSQTAIVDILNEMIAVGDVTGVTEPISHSKAFAVIWGRYLRSTGKPKMPDDAIIKRLEKRFGGLFSMDELHETTFDEDDNQLTVPDAMPNETAISEVKKTYPPVRPKVIALPKLTPSVKPAPPKAVDLEKSLSDDRNDMDDVHEALAEAGVETTFEAVQPANSVKSNAKAKFMQNVGAQAMSRGNPTT